MKIRKMFLGLMTASMGLAGCGSSDSEEVYAENNAIKIAPQITRVSGLHFDTNDEIGLTVVVGQTTEYVRNRKMTYTGSYFEAADLFWHSDATKPAVLTAYYPYSAQGVPVEFSVAANQIAGCAPSSLLVAVKDNVMPGVGAVAMTFSRLCSSVLINIDNKSGSEVTKVVVGGTILSSWTDISRKVIQAKTGVLPADITACPLTAGRIYEVVVIPQTATMSVTFHQANGKTTTKTLASASLASGMQYTLTAEIASDQINIALSAEITNWGNGGTLTEAGGSGGGGGGENPGGGEGGGGENPGGGEGGGGENPGGGEGGGGENPGGGEGGGDSGLENGILTYQGEQYKTVEIAGRIWMAENLRYISSPSLIGNGIWYPVKDGVECADPACIKAFGLFYNLATATAGTSGQGICPDGWQLPDDALLQSLITDKSYDYAAFSPAGGFWNNILGQYGSATKSYLLGVSAAAGGKYNYLLFTTGALQPTLAAFSPDNGVRVRCVKAQ